MRRISIVPLIAAAIVLGHVAPHLLLTHQRASNALATLPSASPPLVAPACRLQAPPPAEDRGEPMLAALRQLIARDEQRYPYLADNSEDALRRLEPCAQSR